MDRGLASWTRRRFLSSVSQTLVLATTHVNKLCYNIVKTRGFCPLYLKSSLTVTWSAKQSENPNVSLVLAQVKTSPVLSRFPTRQYELSFVKLSLVDNSIYDFTTGNWVLDHLVFFLCQKSQPNIQLHSLDTLVILYESSVMCSSQYQCFYPIWCFLHDSPWISIYPHFVE